MELLLWNLLDPLEAENPGAGCRVMIPKKSRFWTQVRLLCDFVFLKTLKIRETLDREIHLMKTRTFS